MGKNNNGNGNNKPCKCNCKCEKTCECSVTVNLNDGEEPFIDGPGTLLIEFLDKGTLQIDYEELLQDSHSYRMKTGTDLIIVPYTSIKYMRLLNSQPSQEVTNE